MQKHPRHQQACQGNWLEFDGTTGSPKAIKKEVFDQLDNFRSRAKWG